MRHNPSDNGGRPHRHGEDKSSVQSWINTASQAAGLINGIYQAGKSVAPYVRPALAGVAAALA